MPKTVAALFVASRGAYINLPGVDPWDIHRDARLYQGPYPVVAHPPCTAWCQLAGLVEARWGHKKGEDQGCFQAALTAVRTYGGVLEHPAKSAAWRAYGLPVPRTTGGWTRGECGGYSCYVEQHSYGHAAKKGTWLYAYGTALPDLRWGSSSKGTALVSFCRNRVAEDESRPRLTKKQAKATPPEFRDMLLSLARSVPSTHTEAPEPDSVLTAKLKF
jgi:hypothetical protein